MIPEEQQPRAVCVPGDAVIALTLAVALVIASAALWCWCLFGDHPITTWRFF